MEINEDVLYAEIGRQVVRGRVLEANLRAAVVENRRLNAEVIRLTAETVDEDVSD